MSQELALVTPLLEANGKHSVVTDDSKKRYSEDIEMNKTSHGDLGTTRCNFFEGDHAPGSPGTTQSRLSGAPKRLTPDSLKWNTLILISSSLGVGMLPLPYAVMKTGLVSGITCIVLAGIISGWMLKGLVSASFRTQSTILKETVDRTLGKTQSLLFQWIFIIYLLGTIINYEITCVAFIVDFLMNRLHLSPDIAEAMSRPTIERAIFVAAINIIIVFPISCARTLQGLRKVSLIIVMTVVYTLIVLVAQAPQYFARNQAEEKEPVYYNFDSNFFSSFAVMVFAYNCVNNLFGIRNEVTNPTERRMSKICRWTMATDIFLYVLYGGVSYLCFLEDTPILVTQRYAIDPDASDLFMNIARFLFCVNTVLAVTVRLIPCRTEVLIFFGKDKNTSSFLHYGLTLFILTLGSVACVLVPDAYAAFTIVGGYGATLTAITYPALTYLAVLRSNELWKKLITWVFLIVGTGLGFTAATQKLLSLIF